MKLSLPPDGMKVIIEELYYAATKSHNDFDIVSDEECRFASEVLINVIHQLSYDTSKNILGLNHNIIDYISFQLKNSERYVRRLDS